eukprot:c21582_g2_i2 orf=132-2873(-)
MSIQSSSSSASSPSLNTPSTTAGNVAAARFNPLFIYTASATHNHKLNHNHSLNLSNNNSTNSMAANSSPNPMVQLPEASSRKVHVVYYLSRSGQLEHPHLLEVSIPPNQGLYLKDVKKRLAAIRGKRLPMTFAWSYKRSYKNGYVWQDLCDDDLIFPAHGCEYVLKGSEILTEQSNNEECGHTPSHNAEAGLATANAPKEDKGLTSRSPKLVYQNSEDSECTADLASLHVSMVESGTDAATQTEEELRPASNDMHEQEEASKSLYINHYKVAAKLSSSCISPHKASCTTTRPQHATELNKGDMASPPSSSSTGNSPSPYKEIASTMSSSASGFNMATDRRDNIGSNDHSKTCNYNLGSKTPGRSWMKRAIHKLEEQDEIISLHGTVDDEGERESVMNNGGSTNSAHENANSKTRHRSMGGNSIGAAILEDAEHSPAASVKQTRGKHSGALSLLQFMSCGGLDIKEQILPMSLYRLRSKGAPATTANQLHMSNYILSPEHPGDDAFDYGSSEAAGPLWSKMGKPKSLYLSSSKTLYKTSDEYTGISDVENQQVHRRYHYPQLEGASAVQATSPSPVANGRSAKAQGGSIPDVISIGRSSISDRSTNVSHELEYQVAEAHAKLKKSGEVTNNYNNIVKGSPHLNAGPVSMDSRSNEGIRSTTSTVAGRAVSGEILMSKGSPLFVPSKRHLSYSGTPLNYAAISKPPLAQLSVSVLHPHESGNNEISTKLDAQSKAYSSSCNPSRAFSEGEVSYMLANRNAMSKSGDQRSMAINGYDQSMAQLWEELLAAPGAVTTKSEEHQHKDADYQRVRQVTMGNSSWEVERTLQNAVELSLQPPLEHLMLHQPHLDCPQCGRKVKAEVLKAHVKSCSSPKPNTKSSSLNNCINTNSSLGKSPKSDSNLCQRFLRASPPPTKL